jgi:hypothetical protein
VKIPDRVRHKLYVNYKLENACKDAMLDYIKDYNGRKIICKTAKGNTIVAIGGGYVAVQRGSGKPQVYFGYINFSGTDHGTIILKVGDETFEV